MLYSFAAMRSMHVFRQVCNPKSGPHACSSARTHRTNPSRFGTNLDEFEKVHQALDGLRSDRMLYPAGIGFGILRPELEGAHEKLFEGLVAADHVTRNVAAESVRVL